MKLLNILFIISGFFIVLSCDKKIDLEVNDVEPQLVIEANYDAIKEEVRVRITKSVNVFATSDFPTVGGAQVEIVDGNGAATPLVDQGNGEYRLRNHAQPGCDVRTASLPFPVRDRRPKGRHGSLRGEARAALQQPLGASPRFMQTWPLVPVDCTEAFGYVRRLRPTGHSGVIDGEYPLSQEDGAQDRAPYRSEHCAPLAHAYLYPQGRGSDRFW